MNHDWKFGWKPEDVEWLPPAKPPEPSEETKAKEGREDAGAPPPKEG